MFKHSICSVEVEASDEAIQEVTCVQQQRPVSTQATCMSLYLYAVSWLREVWAPKTFGERGPPKLLVRGGFPTSQTLLINLLLHDLHEQLNSAGPKKSRYGI